VVPGTEQVEEPEEQDTGEDWGTPRPGTDTDGEQPPRKYYVDEGTVEVIAHLVYELDPDGKQLRVVKFTDYTAEKVRTLYTNAAQLRNEWADPLLRADIIARLEDRGISFDELRTVTNQPDADPFDLLCHVAYNAPLRTRRERADRLRKEEQAFFEQYGPNARHILDELLEKYAEHGVAQFTIPEVLKVPPISTHGNVMEIIQLFGGATELRSAVGELQRLLYAA
jgi:type I restriction enzyme R subunit